MRRTVFNEDHEAFRETIRDFIEAEVVPVYHEWYAAGHAPRDFYYKLGELGVFGIGVPEEYGGAGIDIVKFEAVMYEETARAGVTFGGSGVHVLLGLPYIKMLATDEQKKRWLPKFVSGEEMWAHRDDRAGHRLRPGGHGDHREAVRRRHPLRPQRRQDLHHRRRARGPRHRLRPHRRPPRARTAGSASPSSSWTPRPRATPSAASWTSSA